MTAEAALQVALTLDLQLQLFAQIPFDGDHQRPGLFIRGLQRSLPLQLQRPVAAGLQTAGQRQIEIIPAHIQALYIQAVSTPVRLQLQAPQLLGVIERHLPDLDALYLQSQRQVDIRQAERLGVGVRFARRKIELDTSRHQLIDTQGALEQASRRPGESGLLNLHAAAILFPNQSIGLPALAEAPFERLDRQTRYLRQQPATAG